MPIPYIEQQYKERKVAFVLQSGLNPVDGLALRLTLKEQVVRRKARRMGGERFSKSTPSEKSKTYYMN